MPAALGATAREVSIPYGEGRHVTLGLPIVRTSVDHGTAFDIAWQGKASPRSMVAAISLAAALVRGEAR